MGLLEGLTFLDLSHRLPGPLAGNLLGGLGARVIKVEDKFYQDPFNDGLFSKMDDAFKDWYKGLNNKKEILKLDFSNNEDHRSLKKLVQTSDGIIMGLPPKVRQKLELSDEDLKELNKPLAVIELKASKSRKNFMHELNALALTGLLKLYVNGRKEDFIRPPFLPFSGIAFGQKVGMDLLAGVLKSKREGKAIFITTYLFETAQEVFSPFWPPALQEKKRAKFLHNGLYPCYCIYRTKDGKYVALAAVEKKFWAQFCEIFDFSMEDRFDTSENAFKIVSQKLGGYTQKEIKNKIKGHDICLSLV
ncbi:MAG: CoA transferase [Bdellovibrionota bacterium]|nr:CoA transferase [Bdellovibrionota bacterium]